MVTNDWRALLPYTTSRRLRVDVWQLGLSFKLLQLTILIFVAVDIFNRNAWAHSEVPAGRINSYGEGTDDFTSTLALEDSTVAYCSSPDHDYIFSDSYNYEKPPCRALDPEEVVTKSIGAVTFTTSIIESVELAWACGATDTDALGKKARCDTMIADGGAFHVDGTTKNYTAWKLNTNGMQCKCTTRETYYVKGVEKMGIVFEHGYTTTGKAGGLKGSSSVEGKGLSTQIGPNRFEGGDRIIMSLEDIIALNPQGHTLATKNSDVRKDKRDNNEAVPYFRATGMKLKVDIVYENLYDNSKAGVANSDVDAKVEVTAVGGWAGPGAQVFYIQAPTRDAASGARTYEKMVRYRQGVEVVFVPAGSVYWFDYQHFITVFMGAYLFLAVAVAIMDFVAFNVLPNGVSKVLYAKRAERVSKVHSFAQLGLRAAVAVKDFKALDVDDRGYVEVKDLVSVFGSIPSVDKEEAMMMAQTIMRAADRDTSLQGRLTFNEFMSLFDGTTALDFDQYVKLVHTTGKAEKLDETARAEASKAYDDVAAGVDLKARRSGDADKALPTRPDGTTPAGPTQINCFLCKTLFGVPPGAKLCKCPKCHTVNPTEERPPAHPAGLLGGLPSFGNLNIAGIGGLSHRANHPPAAMQDV
jgi:LSD1 subclass zinc finger protein